VLSSLRTWFSSTIDTTPSIGISFPDRNILSQYDAMRHKDPSNLEHHTLHRREAQLYKKLALALFRTAARNSVTERFCTLSSTTSRKLNLRYSSTNNLFLIIRLSGISLSTVQHSLSCRTCCDILDVAHYRTLAPHSKHLHYYTYNPDPTPHIH
jgi:hypothetical protein